MFVALELKKTSKEAPDLLQDYTLEKINKVAKGLAFKVTPENWNEILLTLTALSKGDEYDRDQIGTA